MKYLIGLFCLSLAAIANFSYAQTALLKGANPVNYKILAERSHKPSLFTQGLVVQDDLFYESSGLYSKSQIVAYPVLEPECTWAKMTTVFTRKQSIPDRFFAEGLTLLNDKLYLLTWKEGTLFVYDAKNFSFLKNMSYQGQGWGLTTDGKQLIRSDGSNQLFFHNVETLGVERTIKVTHKQEPVNNLNELEYAEGFIWANIWHDNRIVKINPVNGDVLGVLDFSTIVKNLNVKDADSVLNGIAYDQRKKAFWITGKQWPKMFLVKLTH